MATHQNVCKTLAYAELKSPGLLLTERAPRDRAGYLHPRGDLLGRPSMVLLQLPTDCGESRLQAPARLRMTAHNSTMHVPETDRLTLSRPNSTTTRFSHSLPLTRRPPLASLSTRFSSRCAQRALLSPLAPCPSPLPAPAGNFQKEGVFLAESGFFVEYFCRRSLLIASRVAL